MCCWLMNTNQINKWEQFLLLLLISLHLIHVHLNVFISLKLLYDYWLSIISFCFRLFLLLVFSSAILFNKLFVVRSPSQSVFRSRVWWVTVTTFACMRTMYTMGILWWRTWWFVVVVSANRWMATIAIATGWFPCRTWCCRWSTRFHYKLSYDFFFCFVGQCFLFDCYFGANS